MTETPQSGNFREKGNSQRLKKSKKFALGNSKYTRQQNISLSGSNKYRRTTDNIFYISDQSSAWRPQSTVGSSLTEKKKWERCVETTDSNFHGQRKLIMRVF